MMYSRLELVLVYHWIGNKAVFIIVRTLHSLVWIGKSFFVCFRLSSLVYQQIATERDREERGLIDKKPLDAISPHTNQRSEKQRTGHTICVSGNSVTEDFLRNQFSTFGKIVNVSMEIEKGRGFITFVKPESAERSINEIHSKTVSGISLQVQLARRQPQIEPINDASSSAVWSTLGKVVFVFSNLLQLF